MTKDKSRYKDEGVVEQAESKVRKMKTAQVINHNIL